jgi:feruloyl esterase
VFHQGGGGCRRAHSLGRQPVGERRRHRRARGGDAESAIYALERRQSRHGAGAGRTGGWASGSADGQASGDDYSYRALGTTIVFAKALAKSFYASAPKWTYFNGCSEGGREAYEVAQRYPTEYDGIVQGCER